MNQRSGAVPHAGHFILRASTFCGCGLSAISPVGFPLTVRMRASLVICGMSMHNYAILYILWVAMRQATFTELRNHAKAYFDIVESGESVRVLRNGKPIADIVPVLAELPSWKRRKAQPLVLDGVSVSRMILEERSSGT